MKKIVVSLMATMFLAFSFGTLSASIIENGVLVAANDKCGDGKKVVEEKCGGNGACGGDKPTKKCGDGKKVVEEKCGSEKKSSKCGDGKKSDKCGSN